MLTSPAPGAVACNREDHERPTAHNEPQAHVDLFEINMSRFDSSPPISIEGFTMGPASLPQNHASPAIWAMSRSLNSAAESCPISLRA